MTRLISISRTGRYVALRAHGGLELVDALGTAPRVTLAGEVIDFACLGTALWMLRPGASAACSTIERRALTSARPCGAPRVVPVRGTAIHTDGHTPAAIVAGTAPVLALEDQLVAIDRPGARVFPLAGQRVIALAADRIELEDVGRRVLARVRLDGTLEEAHALFGGRLVAVRARRDDSDVWTVLRVDGSRVHELVVPARARWTIAGEVGAALGVDASGETWQWLDLRYGAARGEGSTPFPTDAVDLAADGRHVVFAAAADPVPRVAHLPAVELLGARIARPAAVPPDEPSVVEPSVEAELPPTEPALPAPAAAAPAAGSSATPAAPVIDRAHLVARALAGPPALAAETDAAFAPYSRAREHLDDMLDLVHARAVLHGCRAGQAPAIAALLGPGAGAAAEAALPELHTRIAGRVRSTLAVRRTRLPFIDLLHELGLSPLAGHILMIAVAPVERGELARLYRLVAVDPQRPLVDRALVEELLAGGDRALRAQISDELAPNGRLRSLGVLSPAGAAAFAAIEVDPVVLARICDRLAPPAPARPLAELHVAEAALRALADAVRAPRPPAAPPRLVLRGRRGAGRRTLAAALAATVDRATIELDASRWPRHGAAMAAALAAELQRASLCGRIPVVGGLELADATDVEGQDRLRHVLAAHPGPVVVRAPLEVGLPLDPGFDEVVLPPLSETERAAAWRAALARSRGTGDADVLAARWRLSPGQIEDVVAGCRDGEALDVRASQHVARRMGHVATPVRRLADWDRVALPDDILDSIRELVGRAAHRKTVLESWGFDATISTARGLTALFYGPPGTGKTMVAGLIARELGLELYRVDLSRVVSKWIGETEKNLSEVFDAAEDGQVVLLFDEADSLFARRTEVKSSNDRYANLEVNFLLQRLDAFEGIAILTTNLDGSIDPAFKRRLSMRLHFPFPDEDLRKRLWAAHIPASTPTACDFNFDELARRFPLSGGYIRNSALRAAYLAAQERRPLAHEHLLRAVALEYRELGKLAAGGRLE